MVRTHYIYKQPCCCLHFDDWCSHIFTLTLISTHSSKKQNKTGDPHPGNILLCRDPKDGTPHLGLIDYGQVKRLTKQQRHLFCKLLIALDDENREEVVKLMKVAGKFVYRGTHPNRSFFLLHNDQCTHISSLLVCFRL